MIAGLPGLHGLLIATLGIIHYRRTKRSDIFLNAHERQERRIRNLSLSTMLKDRSLATTTLFLMNNPRLRHACGAENK